MRVHFWLPRQIDASRVFWTAVIGLTLYIIAAASYFGSSLILPSIGINRFSNAMPTETDWLLNLKWVLKGPNGKWPQWMDTPQSKPRYERVSSGAMVATIINHATVLLQVDGMNILTDPVYCEQIGPNWLAGPKRVHAPGIKFDDLPPIDAVLLSHDHLDHLDLPTLKRIEGRFHPRYFVGTNMRKLLSDEGLKDIVELGWWEDSSLRVGRIVISFVPAQHESGRSLTDLNTRLWGGFVIRSPAGSVYFAGDTAIGPHFQQIRDKYGPMRLAILPIGAYLPRALEAVSHISPAEAVTAHQILGSRTSIGIHYQTFKLTDEAIDQPIIDLRAAMALNWVQDNDFITPMPGIPWARPDDNGVSGKPLARSKPQSKDRIGKAAI